MTQQGMSTVSHKVREIRGKIQAWLMQEGWKIGELAAPEAQWVIVAEDQGQRKLVIAQKVGTDDQVIIQGSINVAEPVRSQFMALEQAKRRTFLNDLGLMLVQINCQFDGLQEPLEIVTVSQRIYYDAPITKDAFLQRASLVRDGLLVVLWGIARRFGQAPPSSQRDNHVVL